MSYSRQAALWITKISLFAIPFIPLYVSRSLFFPYITGKAFAFRILIEVALISWIFLAIFFEEYRPRKSMMLYAMCTWIGIGILATLFGVNISRSFWSNFERMEGLVSYIHLAAFFVVLAHTFKKEDWKIYFNLFVIAGVLESIYAIFQKLGYFSSIQGGFRVDGTIGNPTYLAAYLTFVVAIAIILLLENKNRMLQILYGSVATLVLFIIYLTATRGATVGFLAGGIIASLVFLIWGNTSYFEKKVKWFALGGLVLLIAIPAILWGARNSTIIQESPVLSRLTSMSLSERTISSRFTIWSMAWDGVKEQPFLGWGPENFGIVFAKYYRPELWFQEPWFDRAHNIIFDWLTNGGIPGLLSYSALLFAFGYVLRGAYKKGRIPFSESVVISIAVLVYLIQNLFVFDNIATYISVFTLFAYAHSAYSDSVEKVSSSSNRESSHTASYRPFAIVLLGILLISVLYIINIRPLKANLDLLSAIQVGRSSISYDIAFSSFESALNRGFLGRQEMREQFTQFALQVGGSSASPELKSRVLSRAIQEARINVEENASDPRAYLFYGVLLARTGNLNGAETIYRTAIEKSPKKQQIYFELGDVYIQNKEYDKAIKMLKIAYDLAPDFTLAQVNLAAVYILNGEQEKADEILLRWRGTADAADQVLVSVYSRLADQYRDSGDVQKANYYIDRLIRTWQTFIKNDPKNSDNRKRLALIYLITGNVQAAQAVLDDGVRINPESRADIEAFIEQVKSGKIGQ